MRTAPPSENRAQGNSLFTSRLSLNRPGENGTGLGYNGGSACTSGLAYSFPNEVCFDVELFVVTLAQGV